MHCKMLMVSLFLDTPLNDWPFTIDLPEGQLIIVIHVFGHVLFRAGCSKLTTSFVNVSFNFQT